MSEPAAKPPPTADETLAAHGLTGAQLMGLVRKAINDELGKRSIYLPPADYEDLHAKLVEQAISLATDHDPNLGTLSLATRAYRNTRWRTLDYIRRERIPAAARHADLDGTEPDTLDVGDITTSNAQRTNWRNAALARNLTIVEWVITVLDRAANDDKP